MKLPTGEEISIRVWSNGRRSYRMDYFGDTYWFDSAKELICDYLAGHMVPYTSSKIGAAGLDLIEVTVEGQAVCCMPSGVESALGEQNRLNILGGMIRELTQHCNLPVPELGYTDYS